MEFRLLKADEIEARISQVSERGVTLLLYKDARCDMNILDETVGPMNWQRSHSRDNANCTVSIWDESKKIWISKEDTGTESYTEAEKGKASDSFKRACFNWGIGRELYTAPFCFFPASDVVMNSGRCNDRFEVVSIMYDSQARKINSVDIVDVKTGKLHTFDHKPVKVKAAAGKAEAPKAAPKPRIAGSDAKPVTEKAPTMLEQLIQKCEQSGVNPDWVAGKCGMKSAQEMDDNMISRCVKNWGQLLDVFGKEMGAA